MEQTNNTANSSKDRPHVSLGSGQSGYVTLEREDVKLLIGEQPTIQELGLSRHTLAYPSQALSTAYSINTDSLTLATEIGGKPW